MPCTGPPSRASAAVLHAPGRCICKLGALPRPPSADLQVRLGQVRSIAADKPASGVSGVSGPVQSHQVARPLAAPRPPRAAAVPTTSTSSPFTGTAPAVLAAPCVLPSSRPPVPDKKKREKRTPRRRRVASRGLRGALRCVCAAFALGLREPRTAHRVRRFLFLLYWLFPERARPRRYSVRKLHFLGDRAGLGGQGRPGDAAATPSPPRGVALQGNARRVKTPLRRAGVASPGKAATGALVQSEGRPSQVPSSSHRQNNFDLIWSATRPPARPPGCPRATSPLAWPALGELVI